MLTFIVLIAHSGHYRDSSQQHSYEMCGVNLEKQWAVESIRLKYQSQVYHVVALGV